MVDLRIILNAETAFFQANQVFSSSFQQLGLTNTFFPPPNCKIPCQLGVKDGLLFTITLDDAGQNFRATAVPVVDDKTGSSLCSIDRGGNITEAPAPGAGSARGQMFDNIKIRARQTLAQLLPQQQSDLQCILQNLKTPGTTALAFQHLDANADGKVTFGEILHYSGTGSSALTDFLAFVGQEMALGAGGEDVSALPGVTLQQVQSPSPNGNVTLFQASASSGISNSIVDPQSGLRSVQLAGFCDWSIRFAPGVAGKKGNGQGPFFDRLSPLDDPSTSSIWSGDFIINDQDCDSVTVVLIGLLAPRADLQQRSEILFPAGSAFEGIVVATMGVGRLAAARGDGQLIMKWGDGGFDGPFQADLEVLPALQRKRAQ